MFRSLLYISPASSVQEDAAREIEQELDTHIAFQIEENIRCGMSPERARDEACFRFGDRQRIAIDCLSALDRTPIRRTHLFVRYGTPLVAGFCLLSLAMSLIVNALIGPLRFDNSDKLVRIGREWDDALVSVNDFITWRTESTSFENLTLFNAGEFSVGFERPSGDPTEYGNQLASTNRMAVMLISESYFDVFGIEPVVGRSFRPRETEYRRANVVLISEALWRKRFDRAPDVTEAVLDLNGIPHRVVGVMPESAQLSHQVDIWKPFVFGLDDYSARHFVVGKLRHGITLDSARIELRAIADTKHLKSLTASVSRPRLFFLRDLYEAAVRGRIIGVTMSAIVLLLLIFGQLAYRSRRALLSDNWAIRSGAAIRGGKPGFILTAAALGTAGGVVVNPLAFGLLGRMGTMFPNDFTVSTGALVVAVAIAFTAGHATVVRRSRRTRSLSEFAN